MKLRSTVTALLFLGVTAFLSLYLLVSLGPTLRDAAPAWRSLQDVVDSTTASVNPALDRHHLFIQLYGGVQRLSGRQVVGDVDPNYQVIRLDDGMLTFPPGSAWLVEAHAAALNDLRVALDERDLPLLYLQAPFKVAPGGDGLPPGYPDYANEAADHFLALLNAAGTETLDLRETLQGAGDWSSFFFRTDHHWNPEGAFVAWQALAELLRSDYGFSVPETCTDPGQFTQTVYEDWFLGSQGKRVGTLYAGTDDFTVYSPTFETAFSYDVPVHDMHRAGTFDEALLFDERLYPRDLFGNNPYTLYAGGDYPTGIIRNRLNPDGPTVVLLRDSFACAFTPFLALGCGELITYDLRYWNEGDNLMAYLNAVQPDLVLVMYSVGSLSVDAQFSFVREG